VSGGVPEGYVLVRLARAEGAAAAPCAAAIVAILESETLYDWARVHPERREFGGRVPAYAVPLADCGARVVVRHAYHGGLLAPLLRDVFLAPTRAPRELAMSLFLRRLGVATPRVLAYATYAAGPMLRRGDVATEEVPDASDLAAFLATADAAGREAAWHATARLLGRLRQAGVWHPDLNARNVLLARNGDTGGVGGLTAVLLDIDRAQLVLPGDPQLGAANLQRLLRSLRKLSGGAAELALGSDDLSRFAAIVRNTPLPALSDDA
jgi:hypothetical protein